MVGGAADSIVIPQTRTGWAAGVAGKGHLTRVTLRCAKANLNSCCSRNSWGMRTASHLGTFSPTLALQEPSPACLLWSRWICSKSTCGSLPMVRRVGPGCAQADGPRGGRSSSNSRIRRLHRACQGSRSNFQGHRPLWIFHSPQEGPKIMSSLGPSRTALKKSDAVF